MKGDIKFFREAIVISISAILLGAILELVFRKVNCKLKKLFKNKPIDGNVLAIVSSCMQISINIIMLYIFYHNVPSISKMLEKANPGMIFPAILFGMQQNIYTPFLNVIDSSQKAS